ncbi:hypothetical protein MTR62_14665 [Novosphingobium sp. 1949]|uniref:Uncharacterized protein n=1 Tax=Novosphingobium organovorum TaxID=2930092 RepID=A0ABT0BFS7_9SPHN|nr:hypothetical protein [Novosphingobium organovorum]MCJ2183927.1 hypothetical protein [Novosphingobium organovorum]
MSKTFVSPLDRAKAVRLKRLVALRKRERLRPALVAFDEIIGTLINEGVSKPYHTAMGSLTGVLRGTYNEVLEQIAASGKDGINSINAIKRSAGTNFQGVCEYAAIRWLETTDLPVCCGPNAPSHLKDELTIYGFDADGGEFSVEPDIDMSFWLPIAEPSSPLLFLSAKTSLVDRAGQAARWKLYLDMHQTTCSHVKETHDCPINRTRIKIKTAHPITHAIVTANIYKIDTTQPEGELQSGQCRNNTYMFKHKYTTRDDNQEYRPPSWKNFSDFPNLVEAVFGRFR